MLASSCFCSANLGYKRTQKQGYLFVLLFKISALKSTMVYYISWHRSGLYHSDPLTACCGRTIVSLCEWYSCCKVQSSLVFQIQCLDSCQYSVSMHCYRIYNSCSWRWICSACPTAKIKVYALHLVTLSSMRRLSVPNVVIGGGCPSTSSKTIIWTCCAEPMFALFCKNVLSGALSHCQAEQFGRSNNYAQAWGATHPSAKRVFRAPLHLPLMFLNYPSCRSQTDL